MKSNQLLYWVVFLVVFCQSHFLIAQEQPESSSSTCIMVVGDSLSYGTFVVEVPGSGYPVLSGQSLASVLDELLHYRQALHVAIYDLSLPAATLMDVSSAGDASSTYELYQLTSQYQALMQYSCQFVVIFPFINDLPEERNVQFANDHWQAMSEFIENILTWQSDGNIILFDYYFKPVTDLGLRVYEEKILPESVTLMNEMIYENCTALSEFYSVNRLYCVSFSSIFSPTSNEHILFQVSNSQFQSRQYIPIDDVGWDFVENYFARDANGVLSTDAVHLNRQAKYDLCNFLWATLLSIDPHYFEFP